MTVIVGTLRPIRDVIVVRPLGWQPSTIIEVVRTGRPVRGEVVAVGPGVNPKKYDHHDKAKRKKFEYSKRFQPCEIKPGDVVELGGLNVFDGRGYAFQEVTVSNEGKTETLILCQEQDVAGVVTQ